MGSATWGLAVFLWLTLGFWRAGWVDLGRAVDVGRFSNGDCRVELIRNVRSGTILARCLRGCEGNMGGRCRGSTVSALGGFIRCGRRRARLPVITRSTLRRLLFRIRGIPFPAPRGCDFGFVSLFTKVKKFELTLRGINKGYIFADR